MVKAHETPRKLELSRVQLHLPENRRIFRQRQEAQGVCTGLIQIPNFLALLGQLGFRLLDRPGYRRLFHFIWSDISNLLASSACIVGMGALLNFREKLPRASN